MPNLQIFIPVLIVLFLLCALTLWFYFKAKQNVEDNNKKNVFYDSYIRDFWAQHSDKFLLALFWLLLVLVISALIMLFIPF